jgi:chromosome segregation ATPase
MLPLAADEDSQKKSRRRRPLSLPGWWRAALLGAVVVWQVYLLGRLAAYGSHLRESRERHEELQGALSKAQGALAALRNSSRDCEVAASEQVDALARGEQSRRALQFKIEEANELNALLNQTAVARDLALRSEQAKRLSLEGSVQTLKEQMNLMQGQLVTAQQQQGTLHSGRRKGGHH